MKVTKSVIDKAAYPTNGNKRFVLWDDELPGLGVRIFPSGKKSFVLSYRSHGRKHLMSLGHYGVLTLESARREARIKLGQIAQGENPLKERQSRSKAKTVGELAQVFLENHSKVHKKSWSEDQRRMRDYLAPLKNTPIQTVTFADVAALHLKMGERSKYEANRSMELLRTMFEKGRQWGMVEPGRGNPVKGFQRFKEKKRDRWVTHEELPRLAKAIETEESVYIKAAIWMYLLIGVRKSEFLKAKWMDVDFHRRELRLEDTKAGNCHFLPLSQTAINLLLTLPRVEGNPYIMVGRKRGHHLVNISGAWRRIRKEANVQDVRLHDLRRTVGSWLAQSGNSLHLIGRVLNHASSDTTKVYARFGQDTVKTALEDHATTMMSLVSSDTREDGPIPARPPSESER